jgi:hypothetical protein
MRARVWASIDFSLIGQSEFIVIRSYPYGVLNARPAVRGAMSCVASRCPTCRDNSHVHRTWP